MKGASGYHYQPHRDVGTGEGQVRQSVRGTNWNSAKRCAERKSFKQKMELFCQFGGKAELKTPAEFTERISDHLYAVCYV